MKLKSAMTKTFAPIKILIAGNPNSGKSSLFNILTGSRQRTGNFHGVTIDRKSATIEIGLRKVSLVDIPGTYSLHPNAYDERIVTQIFTDPTHEDYPDAVLYVTEYNDLESQLLLFTQISDLGIPLVLLLTKQDTQASENVNIDFNKLEEDLETPIYIINARDNKSAELVKKIIDENFLTASQKGKKNKTFIEFLEDEQALIHSCNGTIPSLSPYGKFLLLNHHSWLNSMGSENLDGFRTIAEEAQFKAVASQIYHTGHRIAQIKSIINKSIKRTDTGTSLTDKIDNFLTHKYIGPLLFMGIMFLVFQAIFAWAEYPMIWIETGFSFLGESLRAILPAGLLANLLVDGVIAGLAGVLVFIPQIAILFFFIALLEETGYMSRAVYLFDKPMQRIGLNGKSVVALISGHACAIPAIMSTRTIPDWKERMITIFVTPFVSCSARIPVYTILVAFVVPADMSFLGIFNAQGAVIMGLYLLGIGVAIFSALLMNFIIRRKVKESIMIMELPDYQWPHFQNVWVKVKSKVWSFIREAGRIIILISIGLWFLASFGMPGEMHEAEVLAQQEAIERNLTESEAQNLLSHYKLEHSFAGQLGHLIEPVIKPLGYDWKIGIALITSFAAREVFIGTMSTLYNVGSSEDLLRVSQQMELARNPSTGEKTFTLPVALSLLVFYALAMQCMSTMAVVKKETDSWKWPTLQFIYMTGIAYILSFITFHLASYFI